MAVDYVPKCAADAALGIAGMGNYIGAGMQSILSGYLIKRAEDGTASLMGHVFANGYTIGKKGQTLLYKLCCICLTVGCGIW